MAFQRLGLAILMAATLAALTASAAELSVGSPAPPIDIENWFHEREPVTAFEKGHVYVVEFWATWCGPCIASMPHLAEIQTRHGDDVTVIGVSDEDAATIEAFLEEERDGTTFRQVTSAYSLTSDPDRSVMKDYMEAAGEGGIPTAFIVGKDGVIEWIGHPMQMDEPLAKVIAGEWDRKAYAAERADEVLVRTKSRQIPRLVRRKKFDDALAVFDELIAEVTSDSVRAELEERRLQLQAQARAHAEVQQGSGEQGHVEAVSALLDMAFLLEAGQSAEAAAILDRLIESSTNPEAKNLLEAARAKLASRE